jgi:hypothetical protein
MRNLGDIGLDENQNDEFILLKIDHHIPNHSSKKRKESSLFYVWISRKDKQDFQLESPITHGKDIESGISSNPIDKKISSRIALHFIADARSQQLNIPNIHQGRSDLMQRIS